MAGRLAAAPTAASRDARASTTAASVWSFSVDISGRSVIGSTRPLAPPRAADGGAEPGSTRPRPLPSKAASRFVRYSQSNIVSRSAMTSLPTGVSVSVRYMVGRHGNQAGRTGRVDPALDAPRILIAEQTRRRELRQWLRQAVQSCQPASPRSSAGRTGPARWRSLTGSSGRSDDRPLRAAAAIAVAAGAARLVRRRVAEGTAGLSPSGTTVVPA